MGLNINPGDAQWSYHGFMCFREKITEHFGIELRKMQGFSPHYNDPKTDEEWMKTAIPWSTVKNSIKLFLHHSDCDGQISPASCVLILPELRKAIADWDKLSHDFKNGTYLIKGMEECVKKNKPLIFS